MILLKIVFQDIINIGDNMKDIISKHEDMVVRLVGLIVLVIIILLAI